MHTLIILYIQMSLLGILLFQWFRTVPVSHIIKSGKSQIVDNDRCMECGACAKNCPVAAIEVKQGGGCAQAIIVGKLAGSEANCGCSDEDNGCC